MTCIQIENVTFSYPKRSFSLNIPSFAVPASEQLFIEGPSGFGKSTFLNLITGLLSPQKGAINILNTNLCQLNEREKDQFRADHFGIIFQSLNLIPYLSVLDNIALAPYFSKQKPNTIRSHHNSIHTEAKRLLESLNLNEDLLSQPVNTLSIGQKQRVAIARALIGQPDIIIADEPTSSLDHHNKAEFIELLKQDCERYGATLLFVSHDTSLKNHFSTHYDIRDLNRS